MNTNKPKLTLDQPVTYQITVPGVLEAIWTDGERMLNITTRENDKGQTTSIITSKLDQAALQGLLRRLYNLGLPLISVVWIDRV